MLCYITDQDEEEGCGYLALWILHEDGGWWSLDLQVSLFLLSSWYITVGNVSHPNLKSYGYGNKMRNFLL